MYQATMFMSESTGGGSKIPVGIHQGNIVFDNIVTDQTWTDIKFSEPTTGKTIHKRLFMPTGGNPREGETIQEAYDREVKVNLEAIVKLMVALLGKETASNFGAADYKEFVSKASALLQGVKGVKVNLKVVPDYKEKTYPDLPRYGTYVELHQEGRETSLKYSEKELSAISEMEQKRASERGEGSMNSEDLTSLI